MRRVVITGMSMVCSLGTNHEKVFERLCAREKVIVPIDRSNGSFDNIKTLYYTPVAKLDEEKHNDKLRQIKKKAPKLIYYTAHTALEALEDAGLDTPDDDTSIIIGCSVPLADGIFETYDEMRSKGRINLMTIPSFMDNSPASWLAVTLGVHGRSSIVSSACASGTESIGKAYETIMSDKSDVVICGGCDKLRDKEWIILKGFENLKVVSQDKDGCSYPFSDERTGFLYSEGAVAILVLEELEHALKRNARIYAEITGFEQNCDGYSIIAMPENGEYISAMLKKLVGNKKVDYYNAHGTGTKLNDMAEANAVRNVFGKCSDQPAINSTKAFLGHTISASGAIEAIVCVDSICHNKVHGNMCKTVFNDLNYTQETREMQINCAVSASFGFGGHNAAIMIERYKE